jgi:hypothetical protein
MAFDELKRGYTNLGQLAHKALDAIHGERFDELQSLLTARQNILRQQDVRLSGANLSLEQRSELQSLAGLALDMEKKLHDALRNWLEGCHEALGAIRTAREFLLAEERRESPALLDQIA